MILLALNILIIIFSLFVTRRWKEYTVRFSRMRYVFLCLLPVTLLLFPLELVFLPRGLCIEGWGATAVAVVQFCFLYAALCTSVHAFIVVLRLLATVRDAWSKRLVLMSCLVVIMALMMYWACRGTALSFDFEMRQYPQILSGEYDLMHTLAHTLFCEAILSVWNNFNAVVLVQVLGVALVIMSLFCWARHSGASRWLVWGAAAGIITQFTLLTTIIKDVPYGISLMLLSVGLCQYLLRKNIPSLWMIGLGLSGSACFRYDGFVPFILTVVVLIAYSLLNGRAARRLLYPVCAAILCWMLSFFVLPGLLGAVPGASGTKYAKMAHVICDVVAEGGVINSEDMAVIEREIKPRDILLKNYHFYQESMHPFVSTGHGERYIWNLAGLSEEEHRKYSFAFALTGKGETITKLFFSVARDNPLKVAKILLLNTQLTWNLPKNVHWRKLPHQYLLFYGVVLMLVLARKTRRVSVLIPFVPFVSVPLAMMMAATTYEERYLLPVVLMFPILLMYTAECIRHSGSETSPHAEVM